MSARDRWADLAPRAMSAVVMLAVGGYAVWAGGALFDLLIAACCGGMIWELTRMLAPAHPSKALQLGIAGAILMGVATLLSGTWTLPLLLAFVIVATLQAPVDRRLFATFALWVMCAGFGFVWLRNGVGLSWMVWMVAVVVFTDIAGYFAGKMIGGPKFWPRISPKKTWSGTSAGWVAAALVGWWFAQSNGLGGGVVVLSVLVSMASQLGDVAESALKRKTGVKDSSALIPGHGGLFDRFDGMMGAAVMVLIFVTVWGLPDGTM